MKDRSRLRGILAVVPPYTIAGPPAGMAYLLGTLKASGIHDIGFVDLRLCAAPWPTFTYQPIGIFGESFVMDVPDLPLVLHLLQRLPATDVWEDFETLPWVRRYCFKRSLAPGMLGASLRRTQQLLRSWASGVDRISIAGFSTWTSNYLTTLMAAAELKRLPDPPYVVFGGPQCSESDVSAELALASGLADAVVVGEGEQTLLDLQGNVDPVSRSLSGPTPAGVKTWRNGAVEIGGRRPLLRLENLAPPNFDVMDLDAYSGGKHRRISFQLSRGCTDKCEFCSEWVFWERFRSATAESAIDTLTELQARTGFHRVGFSDSLLNGHPQRLVSFSEGVLASNLRFSWSGFARAQVDKPTANLLSRAGLNSVFIGIESLSNETLEMMNKRRDDVDNIQAIETFLEAGIRVSAGIVAGFPGDSRADFLHTVEVLDSYVDRYRGKLTVSIEPFVMTPISPVFRKRESYGLSLVPWDNEVLEMAPELTPIAARCMERVEGPGQSTERSGRYHYARMMLHRPESVPESTDPASSTYRESLKTVPIDKDWVLAQEKNGSSRDAWILSSAESRSLAFGPIGRSRVEDLVGAEHIRWRWPFAPSTGARGVSFELVSHFGLHPNVVARYCRKSRRLIVVNVTAPSRHPMARFAARLVEFLSERMRSKREILALHEEFGVTKELLHKTLLKWWSDQLLMGVPRAK